MSRSTPCSTEGSLALKSLPSTRPRFTLIEGSLDAVVIPTAEGDARGSTRTLAGPLFALCATLVLIAFVVISVVTADASESRLAETFDGIGTETISVSAGDSLWSISEDHGVEGASVQDVSSWIRRANHLGTSELALGQTLVVPVRR